MVSDSKTNPFEIQGSGIREEVTSIKAKFNSLKANISSQKIEKEHLQKKIVQLRNETKQLEETRLL